MRARLHMSKKSSTFAADFILAYCARTREHDPQSKIHTYDDDAPTLVSNG